MTSPTGGSGQNINLAALWIPIMPETSHLSEQGKQIGKDLKKNIEEGFNSGASPESIGSSFGSKLQQSFSKELKNLEIPFGVSGFAEKFNIEIDKSTEKLRGSASQALERYRQEYQNLIDAQERATAAEKQIQLARDGGFNKASIMLPLISEQTRATNDLKTAQTNAGAALNDYNGKMTKVHEETSKATTGSQVFASMIGTAVVGAVALAIKGVESFVELIAEGFKESIEITKELAEKALELGETYEHIGIQITEFSGASGEAFEELESRAQSVFGTLDVAGADVGKTMAQFASMLDTEPGPALDRLTRYVTDLQGRFSSLKAADLASVFVAFKTPVEQTDTALASLLQSARNSGQDFGQFTSALQGNVALTLSEAGLSLEQAGAFMGDLLKLGEPGRQTMTGLASAMKEFGKEGLTFGDGMKLAAEKLKELGDTAEGQDLAEKLFGTRNWVVAEKAVQDYVDVVDAAPGAFAANASSVDEFINSTETLSNKWEEFKHKAEEGLKPFGDAAKNAATTGLNMISNWFDTHHEEIIGDIQKWGNKFIDLLPVIQEFAADGLRIFGDLGQGLMAILAPLTITLTTAGAGMLALSGHFSDAKDLLEMGLKLPAMPIASMANTLADKIQEIHGYTDDMHVWWNDIADAANRIPPSIGNTVAAQGSAFNPGSSPGGGGSGGGSGSGGPGIAATSGQVLSPNAVSGSPDSNTNANRELARQLFPWDEKEWAAFDELEMHEAGYNSAARNASGAFGIGQFLGHENDAYAGGYSTDPTTQLQTMFKYIADRYGTPSAAWAQYYQHPGGRGYYDQGGAAGKPTSNRFVTQGSGNGDDVPALLGKGEYVWDTDTVDKFGWLIAGLHKGSIKGFGQGGDVGGVSQVIWSDLEDPTVRAAGGDAGIGALYGKPASGGPGSAYSDETNPGGEGFGGHHGHVHTTFNEDPFSGAPYGIRDQNTTLGDYSAFPSWVKQLADLYNVDPKTYVGHQVWNGMNHGIDWYPRGKQDMSGQSYTHTDNEALNNFANAAIAVGTGQMQGFTGGQLGVSPLGYGTGGPGSTPGGKNGGLYPGLPGQYGGNGAYGGQTADQAFSAAQAVQEANDRKADLDYQVGQKQKRIDDLKAELDQVGVGDIGMVSGKPMPRTPAQQAADDKKRKQLNDELDAATHDLTVAQREQGEQGGKITEALRKQQESALKKPTGKSGGNTDAQSLGSGLLEGIGQELGLGDVLGKSPLDWGIVKLAEGLFSYANGLGDAIFGKTDSGGGLFGGTPGGGQGLGGGGDLGGGLASGLLGSLGIKLPSAAISAGPNVVPGAAPTPFGTGGPLPGPAQPGVINQDNSISISPNVDARAVLGPVQAQQNSNNAASFQYAGGVPAQ